MNSRNILYRACVIYSLQDTQFVLKEQCRHFYHSPVPLLFAVFWRSDFNDRNLWLCVFILYLSSCTLLSEFDGPNIQKENDETKGSKTRSPNDLCVTRSSSTFCCRCIVISVNWKAAFFRTLPDDGPVKSCSMCAKKKKTLTYNKLL